MKCIPNTKMELKVYCYQMMDKDTRLFQLFLVKKKTELPFGNLNAMYQPGCSKMALWMTLCSRYAFLHEVYCDQTTDSGRSDDILIFSRKNRTTYL